MMRARHLAFVITPRAREEWLACFERVLAEAPRRHAFPEQHLPGFRAFLHAFSSWMVNAEDAPSPRDAAGAPSRPEPEDSPSPREPDRGRGVR
jgi:truncated hemoglobin YjbI